MKSGAWRSAPTARRLLRPASSMPAKVWDAQTGQVSAEFSGRVTAGSSSAWPGTPTASGSPPPVGRTRAIYGQGLGRDRPGREVFDDDPRAGWRSSSPWRSAPTADTWSRGGRTEPCKSGTPRPARRSARVGAHDRADPGRGVQPRRPAPGLGEQRRDGQSLGLGRRRAWTRSKKPAPYARRPRRRLWRIGWRSARTAGGWRRGARRTRSRSGTCRPARAANPPGTQRGRLRRGLQPRRRRPVGRLGG